MCLLRPLAGIANNLVILVSYLGPKVILAMENEKQCNEKKYIQGF